jgi:hypothetical protein
VILTDVTEGSVSKWYIHWPLKRLSLSPPVLENPIKSTTF